MRIRTYWVYSAEHGPLLLSALDERDLKPDRPLPDWHLQRVAMATANGLEVKFVDVEFSTLRLERIITGDVPLVYGELVDDDT